MTNDTHVRWVARLCTRWTEMGKQLESPWERAQQSRRAWTQPNCWRGPCLQRLHGSQHAAMPGFLRLQKYMEFNIILLFNSGYYIPRCLLDFCVYTENHLLILILHIHWALVDWNGHFKRCKKIPLLPFLTKLPHNVSAASHSVLSATTSKCPLPNSPVEMLSWI